MNRKVLLGLAVIAGAYWFSSKLLLPKPSLDFYPLLPCAFCTNNLIEERKVWSNADYIVMAPHQPLVPGHLLLVPRIHTNQLNPSTGNNFLTAESKILETYSQTFGEQKFGGIVKIQKIGLAAGQTVPHYHIHYYPRMKNSSHLGFQLWYAWDSLFGRPLTSTRLVEYIQVWKSYFSIV